MKEEYKTKLLDKGIKVLSKWKARYIIVEENNYEDLAPNDDVKGEKEILTLIKQSLKNPKVKNLAITGSYGSGKSSVLRTFEKQNSEYGYLNISLASFKEICENNEVKNSNNNPIGNFKILDINEVEKSIIQQIFYRVEDSKIPNSRFKRIKADSKSLVWELYLKSFFIFLWAVSVIILFKGKSLELESIIFQNLFLQIIFVSGCLLFLKDILEIIYKKGIDKVKLKDLEIDLCEKDEGSILNKHLDEILYFFEVTNYDVVVIEDLDRFSNTEIFTKLREINTLINNFEKINRKVTFVYAIKDDIFVDKKERTKFFDFIIPIIPVINSSNSESILMNKLGEYRISSSFISNISLYVDDMRMLKNIRNEFLMYKSRLNYIKDYNKLFAMIVYKNLYPKDFSRLHLNEGNIYEIFRNKKALIEKESKKIEERIKEIKEKLWKLGDESLKNLKELRKVYVGALLEKVPLITKVQLESNYQPLSFLLSENNFNYLKENRITNYISSNSSYAQRLNLAFKELEMLVDENVSYEERVKNITLKEEGKSNKLKLEIERLEKDKKKLQHISLQEILRNTDNDEVFNDEVKSNKLLLFLIRNGWIDEMYHEYISYFYPGSLTNEDKEFLTSIKAGEKLVPDFRLSKLSKIIEKLQLDDYKRRNILNLDLLDYLEKNFEKFSYQYNEVISLLCDESEESINFIELYKEYSGDKPFFIKCLCNKWSNIWNFIESNSVFTKEKKGKYLEDILNYGDLKDIVKINENGILEKTIVMNEEFFELNIDRSKLEVVIKELELKFKRLNISSEKTETFNYIYENNYYEINKKNIELILEKLDSSVSSNNLYSANYTTIRNSKCKKLIGYVDTNLEYYLENVFLEVENNLNESEGVLIDLLDNEKVSKELKESVIKKENTKISFLYCVPKELWEMIIKNNKIKAEWKNIIDYFKEVQEIDETIAIFLNQKENYEDLSKKKISEESEENNEIIKSLSIELLKNELIKIKALRLIVKSYSQGQNSMGLINVSEARVGALIELNMLNLTEENLHELKFNYLDKHIELIRKNIDIFLENPNKFNLEADDLIEILKFTELTPNQKINLVNGLVKGLLGADESDNLLKAIYEVLVKEEVDIKLDNELLNTLIEFEIYEEYKKELFYKQINYLGVEEKIDIFLKIHEIFSKQDIEGFLMNLGEPYSQITKKGSRPSLKVNKNNRELCSRLKERNYISSFKEIGEGIRVNTFKVKKSVS